MFYGNTLITDRGKSWADDTIFWGGSNFDPRPQSWNHRGYPETDPLETSKHTIYTTILKQNHEKHEIHHWHTRTSNRKLKWKTLQDFKMKSNQNYPNKKYKIQNRNKKSSPSSRRRPGRAQRFLASRCFSSPWKVYDLDTGNHTFFIFLFPSTFIVKTCTPKMRKHVS